MTSAPGVYSTGHRVYLSSSVKRPVRIQLVRIVILTLLSVLPVFLTGCTEMIVLTGERVYNHLRGDFLDIVPAKLGDVYTASLEAANHMDHYQVVEHQLTAINGTVTAIDDSAQKTTITLTRTEHDQTQIQIRIGVIGDKLKSAHIYDCIQLHLRNPQIAMSPYIKKSPLAISPHLSNHKTAMAPF